MNTFKLNKMVKKAINVPLVNTLISKNKYFIFDYNLKMFHGIPHIIQAIILANNKKDAFELLKLKLSKTKVDASCCYDPDLTFEELTIEEFAQADTLYNSEYTVLCEPRIDYLLILQGYWDGSSSYDGLTYTLCQYKHKCKPQKEYVNIYEDRNDYFNAHTYYPDERIETEYNADNVEIAQSYIQYLF